MKILYGSVGGTTRRIANRLQRNCGDATELWSAKDLLNEPQNFRVDDLIVCSPTYGDGELESVLESALWGYDWRPWRGRAVAFCEVGIYTGYEEFGHGLVHILRQIFLPHGLEECFPPLAVTSVPLDGTAPIEAWGKSVANAVRCRA
jgi:flavodoxin